MRSWVAIVGVAGVLVLAGGCVSRAEEPSAAGTTTTTTTTTTATTTTSPKPTAVTPDPAIAAEAAGILAAGDVAGFNARICPGTHDIAPVTALGADYAGTQPAGVESHNVPMHGDSVVARLTVRPGTDLMVILGLDFETYEWCAYSVEWCPVGFAGLAPFVIDTEYPALREVAQRVLCR